MKTLLRKDIVKGKRFGSVVVVEMVRSKLCRTFWKVKCDCGRTSVKIDYSLKNLKFCSVRCPEGAEHRYEKNATHHMGRHPVYRVWATMKARCSNPNNKSYPGYGGRGISVCPSWVRSFAEFWSDMGTTWKQGLQLDRINNDGGYEPGNCRWVTPVENARNKPWCTTPSWAFDNMDKHGIGMPVFHERLRRGWTVEKASTVPVRTFTWRNRQPKQATP